MTPFDAGRIAFRDGTPKLAVFCPYFGTDRVQWFAGWDCEKAKSYA